MNTQKVAVTIPINLVAMIDEISRKQGISRSKYISAALYEKIQEEKERIIKDSYDSVFSDEEICKEQLETAEWFEGKGNSGGQEW